MDPAVVVDVGRRLLDLGCYEVVVSDTLGSASPENVEAVLERVFKAIPVEHVAAHFHNTFDRGVENALMAVEMGVTKIDSSCAGLGGCPYAKSATGNVGTEDVLHAFKSLGIETGVDEALTLKASKHICATLGIIPPSARARELLS